MDKWCTYSHINGEIPQHIGKVVHIDANSCKVKYSADQTFAEHCWDIAYVRIFNTLESAIFYVYTNSEFDYMSEIEQDLSYSFPNDAKSVKWDTILRSMKIKKLMKT